MNLSVDSANLFESLLNILGLSKEKSRLVFLVFLLGGDFLIFSLPTDLVWMWKLFKPCSNPSNLSNPSNNDCLWKYKLYFFDNLKHLLTTLKNSLSKSLLACNYALSHQKDSSHQQLFRNWEIRFSIAHPLKDPTHLTMLGWLALPSCLRREISRRTDMGTPSSVRASFT